MMTHIFESRTVSPLPLEVHPRRKCTFCAYSALDFEAIFWGRLLNHLRLEDEASVTTLCSCRETRSNLLLGSK